MDRSERTDKLLNIIDRLLGVIEYEQLCDALECDECDDSDEDENEKPEWLVEVEEFRKSGKPLSEVGGFKYEEDDDYKDCRSHINKDGLPENNLVKCIGVDKDGNGIYKFK